MCRVALRAGAWALAATVMITLAAGCSVSGRTAPPGRGPGPQIFTMKMVTDHRRLDRGVLAYRALTTMQVRQAASLEVEVTDVGRGPETSAFARQSRGWVVDRQNVPTGGSVSVQIACGAGLTCMPRTSPARQAILGPGRSATWTWNITARSPGADQVLITAVSYRGDSRVVASQTSAAAVVKVQSTPLYTLEAAVDARRKAVVFVVADVLAALLVLGVVLDVRRRRRGRSRPVSRPAGRAAGGAPPQPARSARTWPARSARTWPARSARTWPARSARTWPRLRGRSWPAFWGRSWLGLRGWAWLLLAAVDIAVGALVVVLVRHDTSKSPAFALIAAGVAAVVVVLPVYFLPIFVARARRVPDLAPVVVINVFLGWTFVGWVVALALAVRERRPGRVAAPQPDRELQGRTAAPGPDRELRGRTAGPQPDRERPRPGADVTVPRMRLQPVPPRGSATLNVWQTPDDGLSCQQPGEDWVRRWTYGVLLGEDAEPRFVLTGERHGSLADLDPRGKAPA
jgi:Superinfection immunity protein